MRGQDVHTSLITGHNRSSRLKFDPTYRKPCVCLSCRSSRSAWTVFASPAVYSLYVVRTLNLRASSQKSGQKKSDSGDSNNGVVPTAPPFPFPSLPSRGRGDNVKSKNVSKTNNVPDRRWWSFGI